MQFKINDKVKYLHTTQIGTITKIINSKMVMVLDDEHGFENPTGVDEILKIEIPKAKVEIKEVEPEVPEEKEIIIDADALRLAMLEKNDSKAKNKAQNTIKKSMLGTSINDPIEIDLHIHNLIDSTIGMSNYDMLQLQLKTFCNTIEKHKKEIGRKLIFIHGNGDGTLRQNIELLAKTKYKHHQFYPASFQKYGHGAVVVLIRNSEFGTRN